MFYIRSSLTTHALSDSSTTLLLHRLDAADGDVIPQRPTHTQRRMFIFLLSFLLVALYLLRREYLSRTRRHREYGSKIPGPKPLPLIGNALEFGLTTKAVFEYVKRLTREYGPVCSAWVGPKLGILLADPASIEIFIFSVYHILDLAFSNHRVLGSLEEALGGKKFCTDNEVKDAVLGCYAVSHKFVLQLVFSKNMNKSSFYQFAEAWLGKGILLSKADIWKKHKKIVAPTFNNQILAQFIDIFNSNVDILVEILSQRQNGPEFDIFPLMSLFALDIICQSAMGVKVNAQLESGSDFVKGVSCLEEIMFTRGYKPWLHPDLIYKFTSLGRQQAKYLPMVLNMTKRVIQERKQLRLTESTANTADEDADVGYKKKRAFLDYFLDYIAKGAEWTTEELEDEVNTIMLAGHDTTAITLSYCCWLLAKHQLVQERVVAELRTIFGDSLRHTTLQDINEMKYMEQVVKESLRLYPPVPLFGRILSEDVHTDKYVFPAGCEVGVNVYMLHRHPDYFPDPERFDPDRFLPENSVGRHPYCYTPFGAAPRMCLGYKYAMYEMKTTLSQLLRQFKILPPENPFLDLQLVPQIVMKSKNGVPIRLQPRNFLQG